MPSASAPSGRRQLGPSALASRNWAVEGSDLGLAIGTGTDVAIEVSGAPAAGGDRIRTPH